LIATHSEWFGLAASYIKYSLHRKDSDYCETIQCKTKVQYCRLPYGHHSVVFYLFFYYRLAVKAGKGVTVALQKFFQSVKTLRTVFVKTLWTASKLMGKTQKTRRKKYKLIIYCDHLRAVFKFQNFRAKNISTFYKYKTLIKFVWNEDLNCLESFCLTKFVKKYWRVTPVKYLEKSSYSAKYCFMTFWTFFSINFLF